MKQNESELISATYRQVTAARKRNVYLGAIAIVFLSGSIYMAFFSEIRFSLFFGTVLLILVFTGQVFISGNKSFDDIFVSRCQRCGEIIEASALPFMKMPNFCKGCGLPIKDFRKH